MRCDEAQEWFSAYADLPEWAPERLAMDAHIADCSACEKQFQLWQESAELIAQAQLFEELEPSALQSDRLNRSVMDRIYAEQTWYLPAVRKTYAFTHAFRMKIAGVLAGLLAIFGWAFLYAAWNGIAGDPRYGSGSLNATFSLIGEGAGTQTVVVPVASLSDPIVLHVSPAMPEYWFVLSLLGMIMMLLILNWFFPGARMNAALRSRLGWIRHGQTEWNRLGKIQGAVDIPLNDEGIRQAELLADRLANDKDYQWHGIISSDLQRAEKTAAIIANRLDLPVYTDDRLRERTFGDAEGMTMPDRVARWGDNWREQVPNQESNETILDRGRAFVRDHLQRHAGESWLIVTHGSFLARMLHLLCPDLQDAPILNASLTILEQHEAGWLPVVHHCTKHLNEMPRHP